MDNCLSHDATSQALQSKANKVISQLSRSLDVDDSCSSIPRPLIGVSKTDQMEALIAKYTTPPSEEGVVVNKCRPGNYSEFLNRLHSFHKTSAWFAKPSSITAIECARFGWCNGGYNKLRCFCCNNELTHDPEGDSSGAIIRARIENEGHAETCGWRTHACQPSFLVFPHTSSDDIYKEWLSRFFSILEHFSSRNAQCNTKRPIISSCDDGKDKAKDKELVSSTKTHHTITLPVFSPPAKQLNDFIFGSEEPTDGTDRCYKCTISGDYPPADRVSSYVCAYRDTYRDGGSAAIQQARARGREAGASSSSFSSPSSLSSSPPSSSSFPSSNHLSSSTTKHAGEDFSLVVHLLARYSARMIDPFAQPDPLGAIDTTTTTSDADTGADLTVVEEEMKGIFIVSLVLAAFGWQADGNISDSQLSQKTPSQGIESLQNKRKREAHMEESSRVVLHCRLCGRHIAVNGMDRTTDAWNDIDPVSQHKYYCPWVSRQNQWTWHADSQTFSSSSIGGSGSSGSSGGVDGISASSSSSSSGRGSSSDSESEKRMEHASLSTAALVGIDTSTSPYSWELTMAALVQKLFPPATISRLDTTELGAARTTADPSSSSAGRAGDGGDGGDGASVGASRTWTTMLCSGYGGGSEPSTAASSFLPSAEGAYKRIKRVLSLVGNELG